MSTDNVEVAAENTYTEAADETNGNMDGAEATGITVDGENYYALAGTFADGEDNDRYEVAVDASLFPDDTTAYEFELVPCVNDAPVGLFKKLMFPASAVSYDADGGVITNHLLVGAGLSVKPGTAKIVFNIYGKDAPAESTEEEKKAWEYYNGNAYSLKFK